MIRLSPRRLAAAAAALIAILGTAAITAAQAQTTTTTTSTATTTIPSGRLLASNCFQCHGTQGKASGFERLAGKSSADIYEELIEYRSGAEGHGIMAVHARGYTDAQLRAIANYLSTVR